MAANGVREHQGLSQGKAKGKDGAEKSRQAL